MRKLLTNATLPQQQSHHCMPYFMRKLMIQRPGSIYRTYNYLLTFTPSSSQLILTLTTELDLGSSPEARLTRLSLLFSRTRSKMPGPSEGGGPEGQDEREVTPPSLTKEQIEGHLSALRSLIKDHNRNNKTDPIQLDFYEEDTAAKDTRIVKEKEVVDDGLRKPFKEVLKTPLTRRIIEFASPEYKIPNNIKLYDGTTNSKDHLDLREALAARYSVRIVCFKEPHEITKIVRRSNESLTAFKERWTVKTGFIMGVSEVMKILSFIDSLKCPKDFAQMELPKGETGEQHRKSYFPPVRRDDSPLRNSNHMTDQRRYNLRNNHKRRDNYVPYRGRDNRPPYPPSRGDYQAREKGHHTNDCHHLKSQLEAALESGKPNHLIRDVRQKGRGNQKGDGLEQAKIINMIRIKSLKEKKRKAREVTEEWMNTPITFPPVSTEDVSDEPLIVEAEVEGYLVMRIYVDRGESVEVMFEHCFENLSQAIKARLKETQMDLVGFIGEATKPLDKIKLEVCFRNEGLCRRTTMKFTVNRAPSPYNVILGRTGLKTLRAIPSTIYSMMKFPTLKGVATLVTRSVVISECRRLEKKHLVVIGGGLPETCKAQLKLLLKENMDIFALVPSDMTGVPRRVIEHNLNVDTSIKTERQKRRVLALEKGKLVAKDVNE
uniref:Reverse transcriptase domain-containing protein n=1 Tax=Tanacetum cinerariifolium TaxID=118510 RepID=A0A6L2JBF1_TANCI|nr:reverse transcriptase domain-containing protein [Tanacetum cinerariifolium]